MKDSSRTDASTTQSYTRVNVSHRTTRASHGDIVVEVSLGHRPYSNVLLHVGIVRLVLFICVPSSFDMSNLTRWAPPPIETWDLRADCVLYAEVASSIWKSAANDTCSLDVDALHDYVLSSLPTNISRPARQQTALWYLATCDKVDGDRSGREQTAALDFRFKVLSMPIHGHCDKELRSAFDIKGNADIAGAGVVASLCIESLLVTAFVVVWALRPARPRGRQYKHRSAERRAVEGAFEAVLPTFYWSSAVLSLGIISGALIAAAPTYKRDQVMRWKQRRAPYNLYDAHLAATAASFSLLPPSIAGLILQQTSGRHRRLLNAAVMPILAVLFVPLCYLTLTAKHTGIEGIVVMAYIRRTMSLVEDYTAIAIAMTLTILTICESLAGVVAWKGRRAKALIYVVLAFLLATLWTTLALLFVARNVVIEFSGGDDPQSEWGFGQVLALTTWIPVVIDFFYTLSGLERHLPEDYCVVLMADVEDDAAMPLRRSTF
ncbi:hypothetical protein CMUS01_06746 [Colletotrichum musicola]|uniref:Uncharacterized protein n=1 Tax=Colletotrichum musicola TaxID=2175873 RepID=A0A8H6KJX2_9PEZI|nr:hypothetical protein CMUS01_06746 [Colletotrichum musicola]